jgi:hypothetical protein
MLFIYNPRLFTAASNAGGFFVYAKVAGIVFIKIQMLPFFHLKVKGVVQ